MFSWVYLYLSHLLGWILILFFFGFQHIPQILSSSPFCKHPRFSWFLLPLREFSPRKQEFPPTELPEVLTLRLAWSVRKICTGFAKRSSFARGKALAERKNMRRAQADTDGINTKFTGKYLCSVVFRTNTFLRDRLLGTCQQERNKRCPCFGDHWHS